MIAILGMTSAMEMPKVATLGFDPMLQPLTTFDPNPNANPSGFALGVGSKFLGYQNYRTATPHTNDFFRAVVNTDAQDNSTAPDIVRFAYSSPVREIRPPKDPPHSWIFCAFVKVWRAMTSQPLKIRKRVIYHWKENKK